MTENLPKDRPEFLWELMEAMPVGASVKIAGPVATDGSTFYKGEDGLWRRKNEVAGWMPQNFTDKIVPVL